MSVNISDGLYNSGGNTMTPTQFLSSLSSGGSCPSCPSQSTTQTQSSGQSMPSTINVSIRGYTFVDVIIIGALASLTAIASYYLAKS